MGRRSISIGRLLGRIVFAVEQPAPNTQSSAQSNAFSPRKARGEKALDARESLKAG
jgi:hypothetical protein